MQDEHCRLRDCFDVIALCDRLGDGKTILNQALNVCVDRFGDEPLGLLRGVLSDGDAAWQIRHIGAVAAILAPFDDDQITFGFHLLPHFGL